MKVTLYVGGLPAHYDEAKLEQLFNSFGVIHETRLITKEDGQCRGFAYVTFADDLAAAKARVALNRIAHKMPVRVRFAKRRPKL